MASIRLPAPLEARLSRLAEATGRPKSFFIRETLERHLDEMEDLYLSEHVLERIRDGKGKTFTLEQVEEMLNLTPETADASHRQD